MDQVYLESDRLLLRPLRPGDEDQIVEYADHEENWRYTLLELYPYYPEMARDFIAQSIRGWETGKRLVFGIQLKTEGRLVGAVDLRIDPDRCGEIGYMIGNQQWGKGIAPEAVRMVIGFAFGTLKLHRIQAGIFEENPRSMRVLEKCGFTREGVERERFFRTGRWMDAVLYSILESEFDPTSIRERKDNP
jgi:ribosomal-protein-alanine N-acetyltransferase